MVQFSTKCAISEKNHGSTKLILKQNQFKIKEIMAQNSTNPINF